MHRLFIDQNVRVEVAEALRHDGYEVIHASEANLDRRDDEEILRFATARGLAIVTFDVDFAELAFWSREPHHVIIRLKIEPQIPSHVLPILRRFLSTHTKESLEDSLVILAENKVRIRRWQ
jgi:predicted nuclease of predicted toxin-antitoxin system